VKAYLDRGAIHAWFWGHEHRCVAYKPFDNLPAPRCIGHGGIPEPAHLTLVSLLKMIKQWVTGLFTARRARFVFVEQEYKETHVHEGRKWRKQGFAILDLDDDGAWVRYVDEDGIEHWFDGLNLKETAAAALARARTAAKTRFAIVP
jgi:hypothetical protein